MNSTKTNHQTPSKNDGNFYKVRSEKAKASFVFNLLETMLISLTRFKLSRLEKPRFHLASHLESSTQVNEEGLIQQVHYYIGKPCRDGEGPPKVKCNNSFQQEMQFKSEQRKMNFHANSTHLTQTQMGMGFKNLHEKKWQRSLVATFLMLFTITFNLVAQLPTADVKLMSLIDKSQPALGDRVKYTLYIKNEGTTAAKNIVIEDMIPVGGVTYVSAAPQSPTTWAYNNAGVGTWTVPTLAAGDSLKLEVVAEVTARGVYFNVAEVKTMDEEDYDSVPNNKKMYEDDITTACFSVPILWYLGDEYTVSIPTMYGMVTNTVWKRNNITIGNATPEATVNTDGTLTIKGAGSYTFTSSISTCNATGCCAIEVIEDTRFDLALKKTTNATSVIPGQDVPYTITVYNQGNVGATAIQVVDYIPTGFTLNDANWEMTATGQATLKTPIASLAAGANTTVTIMLKVNANVLDGASLVNLAEIASAKGPSGETVTDIDSTPDKNSLNDGTPKNDVTSEDGKKGGDEDDHDPATVTVLNKIFDLALKKTTTATTVVPGQDVPFTITVYNQGNVGATAIQVVDYIPSGFTLNDVNWEMTSTGQATLKNPIAVLAAGANTTVSIMLKVNANVLDGASLVNLAEIASAKGAAGETVTDIDSTPDKDSLNDGTPKNDVTSEDGKNGGDEDDHDPATVTVLNKIFDLALKKTTNATSVIPGQDVPYTITVYNQGNVGATAIQVVDYIPAGFTLNDANWEMTATGQATLKTPIASLAAGANTTVTIMLKVNANVLDGASLVNLAEIASAKGPAGETVTDVDSTPDKDSLNDGTPKNDVTSEDGKNGGDEDDHDPATVTVSFGTVFDLALRKTTTATNVKRGETVAFTIEVINQGTEPATEVQVADYIPSGFILDDNSWTVTNGIAYKTVAGTIAPAASASLTINLKVKNDAALGSLKNFAEIANASDRNGDPKVDVDSSPDDIFDNDGTPKDNIISENRKTNPNDDEDDHDLAGVTVIGNFDLALKKTLASALPLEPGQDVIFTITVYNQGEENATNIQVTDYIPTGLLLNDTGWNNNGGKATLKTKIANLAASASTSVDIKMKIDPAFTGTSIINTAEISEAKGPNGETVTDVDSTPDDVATNDGTPKDDVINENGTIGGDEDDHDIANLPVKQVNCESLVSAIATNATICIGDTTYLVGTSSNGVQIKWYLSAVGGTPVATTVSGTQQMILPTTTTTYYAELATVASPTCPNPRIPAVVVVNARPANPTCGETVDVCQGGKINLNDHIINDITTPGGTFEWHTGAKSSSPLVATPTSVGVGRYYLFEKSGTGCYSNPALLVIKEKVCDNPIDLSLNKVADKRVVRKGEIVTYTITVNNDGPNVATNVEVTDKLPAGLNFVSSTVFVNTANTLKATIATINVGQTVTLQFKAEVVGSGTVVNFSQVTAADQKDKDSTPGNGPAVNEDDDDDETITVESFDLALTKTANAISGNAGESITYTIGVTNQGTIDATSVLVADNIPAGLTLNDANWKIENGKAVLKTPITRINAGNSANVSITFTIDVNASGVIKNVAEIIGQKDGAGNTVTDGDSTPNNNVEGEDDQDDATITIVPKTPCESILTYSATDADICMSDVTNLVATSSKGSAIKWYLTAVGGTAIATTTSGQQYAVQPTTTTTYYAEVASVDASCPNPRMPVVVVVNALPANPTCGESVDICSNEVVNLNDQIINDVTTPGGMFEWRLGARASSALVTNPTAVGPGRYYLFEKSGAGCYSNPALLVVKEKSCDKLIDLSLLKTANKRNVVKDELVTYVIDLKNSGPNAATNVQIQDKLPVGLQFVSSSDFTNVGGTLTATVPTINVNQSISLTFVAKVVGTGTIYNYAQVIAADQKDVDSTPNNGPAINEDDDDDEIIFVEITEKIADLSLTKVVSNLTPKSGDNLTYKIRVLNQGPEIATNVEAVDRLPAGLEFVSASGADAISVSGSTVTAKFNQILVGFEGTLTVIAKVVATSGSITNTAEVTKADQADIDSTPGNNSSTEDDDASVTVTVNESCQAITPLISCANPYICNGESVTITAIGCNGNGTVVWSNGMTGTTITVSPSVATVYTAQCRITPTCISGTSNPVQVVVGSIAPPLVNASNNSICAGQSVTLTATNCTGSIKWSNGMVGASIIVTPNITTSYTATCKVATCESYPSDRVTITVGNTTTAPTITASASSICTGGNVTITALGCAGTVTWSNGMTGTSIVVNPIVTTGYTAKCTSGACTSPASIEKVITVGQLQTPTITASKDVTCGNEQVVLTASNCSETVTWNTGITGTTLTVSPSVTTTYTATCGSGACAGSASKMITVGSGGTAPTITANKDNVCEGTQVTLTAAGCTGTITWNTGATGTIITVAPSTTTTYTATCTTGTSCQGSTTKTVTVVAKPAAPIVTCGKERICAGETLTFTAHNCDGTVKWSNGMTGTSMVVSPTTTTVYTATCSVNGCESPIAKEVTIVVITETPTITASKETVCGGQEVTLTAANCSGTLTWSTGEKTPSIVVKPTTTFTYTVLCSVEGCEATATKTITVSGNAQTPVITASKETVCAGEAITLTASNCSGTVTWNTGATGTTITVLPTAATTYTATCGTGSCSASASKTIAVGFGETPIITSAKDATCGNESVTLTANGCSGTVTWSTGATGSAITVAPTATTTYSATCGAGACAKTASKTISVTLPTTPVISASKTQVCTSETVTLTATGCAGTVKWSNTMEGASITVTVSATTTYAASCMVGTCTSGKSNDVTISVVTPATPTITASKNTACVSESITLTAAGCTGTVTWSTGATGNSITVAPTATTTYTATCGAGTCAGSATKLITVVGGEIPTITASKDAVCGGESITLTATTCSGAVTWSTGATGTSITVAPTATTTYTATCGTGACSGSSSKVITVTQPTAPVISANKTTLCAAGEVTLTATNCAGTVVWSNSQEGNSINVLVSATTTYAASCKVGTCTSGKSNDITVTISGGETPVINASKETICASEEVTLTAANCTGTLVWSTGAATASIKVTPVATTTYTVTCTKNECTGMASKTITVGSTSTPTITATKATICGGESTTLTVAGCASSILWSSGQTVASITVSPIATTTYTATCGTGACAASVSQTVTVNVPTVPVITASKSQLCAAESVTLTATNCTGTVTWSNGKTGTSITETVNANTTYTATCSIGSCVSTSSTAINITVGKPTAPVISASGLSVCSGSSVTLTATGCTGTVVWSNGMSGASVTVSPVAKTTYTAVCRVGTAECTSNASNEVAIIVTGKPNSPVISCSATSICPGEAITFNALGCDGSVVWSNGMTGASMTVSPTATIAYTASCKIGDCVSAPSAAATVNVGNPVAPLIVCKNVQLCAGASTTIEAKGCIGTVKWSDGQVGTVITVSPLVMTSYSSVCEGTTCKSGESNIITIAVVGSVTKPITKDLVNTCPNVTVDLTTGVTSTPSQGATYSFHTGNAITSPKIADPSKVAAGTYYVFENVGNGCSSAASTINVAINSCEVSVNCATNPATAMAGRDTTVCLNNDVFALNGKIGGAAKSSTWTSDGTGTFANTLSAKTTYAYSVADVNRGFVNFTLTSDDPDGSGACVAATSSFKLTINAVKTKPTITVNKSSNICFGDSVTLTAAESGDYTYLWSTGATTKSIVVKATGTYTVKLINTTGCCSVSSDAKVVTIGASIAAPTVNAVASNTCPATSVNLATSVTSTPKSTGGVFEYHTANSVTSPMLANVSAVPTGDYFVFEKSDLGCYSSSSLIKVLINDCGNTGGSTTADVQVLIVGSKAEVVIGDEMTYTITVKNNGPATATKVKVVNTLPAGITLVSGATGLQKVDNVLSATIPSLALNQTVTYTYVGKITKAGKIPNVVEMTGLDQVDPVASNNYSKYEVECKTCQEACVAMALSADTLKQANGTYNVRFKAIVQNCGNIELSGVEVTEDLAAMFTSPTTFSIVQQPTVNSGSKLVPNNGYNGSTSIQLVDKLTSKLPATSVDTITFVVNVIPNNKLGPFSTNAIVKAEGMSIFNTLLETSDVSNSGTIIEKPSAEPTVIRLFKSPSLGIALAVLDTVKQADNCYNVTYQAIVKNNGSVNLTNVVISDSLFKAFPAPATFSMVGVPTVNATSALAINSAFTGKAGNVNLTLPTSTLAIGKTDTVRFVVKLCPADIKKFENQVIAQGTGKLEDNTTQVVVDVSNSGYNPDAPGSNKTELIFGSGDNTSIQIPCVGIALYASDVAKQADSSYNITYKALIKNCGNLSLSSVSICDTLANTFASPAVATIVGKPRLNADSQLKLDTTYNGVTKVCMIDSVGSILAPNKLDTLTWVVNVVPNANNGPFRNNVVVRAKSPSGQIVTDISNDGNNPLPQGNAPTVVDLNQANEIVGIAKEVKSIAKVEGSSTKFDIVFGFVVKNYGKVDLTNIQVKDNLAAVFGDSVSIDSVKVTADAGLTTNPAYTGKGDLINLLVDSTSTLPRNTSKTIELAVRVNLLEAKTRVFENVALATAKNGTISTDDLSTTGTNPDPDANGNPKDNSIVTKVDFGNAITPAVFTPLGIAKAASVDTAKAVGGYLVTYKVIVKNYGTRDLTKVQLVDDLDKAFDSDSTDFVVVGLPTVNTGSKLKIDNTFNGTTKSSILVADSSSLAVGKTDTITFKVKVLNKSSVSKTYKNAITGSALDSAAVVTDISQTGLNPDVNNDKNPGNDSEPTQIVIKGESKTDSVAITIAEGFSPNGDGNNDKFVIKGITEADNIKVAIYNRWGQLVYVSENYRKDFPDEKAGWDGKVNKGTLTNDQGVADGTYFYCIESTNAKLFNGKPVYNFITVAR